jgi:hypothetical protein
VSPWFGISCVEAGAYKRFSAADADDFAGEMVAVPSNAADFKPLEAEAEAGPGKLP